MTTKRILVIDDEDDIREVVQLSLEIGGWEVLTACSGSEGFAKAEAEQPDAILLDVMMPDLDGVSTFRQLQANTLTLCIPVILLTAKVQAADQRRFAELAVAGTISKPFNPLHLTSQIAQALGWRLQAL